MLQIDSMKSARTGRAVANQVIIQIEGYRLFYSYGTLIAIQRAGGRVQLSARYYRYSRTTSRYLAQFLRCTAAEIEKAIRAGEYELKDLQRIAITFSINSPQVLAS